MALSSLTLNSIDAGVLNTNAFQNSKSSDILPQNTQVTVKKSDSGSETKVAPSSDASYSVEISPEAQKASARVKYNRATDAAESTYQQQKQTAKSNYNQALQRAEAAYSLAKQRAKAAYETQLNSVSGTQVRESSDNNTEAESNTETETDASAEISG